ncbi:MAG TPA: tyrosine-type recombinase/integrase [Geodermatophilus sp.]|nr:tyrosine-type recombinase/integrase [Geodermatophilus sp.]
MRAQPARLRIVPARNPRDGRPAGPPGRLPPQAAHRRRERHRGRRHRQIRHTRDAPAAHRADPGRPRRAAVPPLPRQRPGRPRPDLAGRRGASLGQLPRRFFDPAAKAAGLEDRSPHDLRHTAASLLVASGANVEAVQRMLGRASAAKGAVWAPVEIRDLDGQRPPP